MENLRIVVAGHIGHGKNTLIGRLLYETDSLPPDISDEIRRSKASGCKEEFALAVEQLAKEHVTDVPHIGFKTAQRSYTFIVPSDHRGFLKNMVTGLIEADAAILVIDASKGLLSQTYQYAYLLAIFGIREVVVVVNKMDLKLHNKVRFWEVSEEIADFLKKLNMHIVGIIPASAQHSDNITAKSNRIDWNTSSTLMKSLGYFSAPKNQTRLPLRLMVQSPFLTDSKTKILGKVASGKLFRGHQLTFGPTCHTAKVLSIEVLGQERTSAGPGQSVALVLEDTSYLERGQVGFDVRHPPLTTNSLIADLFWIGTKSLKPDDEIDVLCGTRHCSGQIEKISNIADPACLGVNRDYVGQLTESQVANVRIKLDSPVCIDPFDELPELGKFAIVQDDKITGGGIFKRQIHSGRSR